MGQRSLRPLPPQLRTPGAEGTHQDTGLLRGQHIALLAHLVVGQQGHHTYREGGPQAVTLAQRPVQGQRNWAGPLPPGFQQHWGRGSSVSIQPPRRVFGGQ